MTTALCAWQAALEKLLVKCVHVLSHLPEEQAPQVRDSVLLFLVLHGTCQGQSDYRWFSIIYGKVLLQ